MIDRPLTDHAGRPLRGVRYQLLLADGTLREGVADDDGRIREEDVPFGRFELCVLTERRPLDMAIPEPLLGSARVPGGEPEAEVLDAAERELPIGLALLRADRKDDPPGQAVRLEARICGAEDKTAVFHILDAESGAPVDEVEAPVRDGRVEAEWSLPGADQPAPGDVPAADPEPEEPEESGDGQEPDEEEDDDEHAEAGSVDDGAASAGATAPHRFELEVEVDGRRLTASPPTRF